MEARLHGTRGAPLVKDRRRELGVRPRHGTRAVHGGKAAWYARGALRV